MPGNTLTTPLGPVSLTEADGQITGLHWRPGEADPTDLTREALRQLQACFDRRLTRFDLPLHFGTGLNEQVCRAMFGIPLGETGTCGDLARSLNASAHAIGQACGANPIPIIIPCHRIPGAHSPGGIPAKGGVETKVWLLKHEGAASLLI